MTQIALGFYSALVTRATCVYAIEHGIDMLDCVLPTRNARHATVWAVDDEKMHLTNAQYIEDPTVIMEGCDCYTCAGGYSTRIPPSPV